MIDCARFTRNPDVKLFRRQVDGKRAFQANLCPFSRSNLDAAARLMPLRRFISPVDPMWLSTMKAIPAHSRRLVVARRPPEIKVGTCVAI
jgi:hypothetical protein